MQQEIKNFLPTYTEKCEKGNIISHLVGFALSILATLVLLGIAISNKSASQIVCMSIFGASSINLFACSTIYHSTTNEVKRRYRQRYDHLSISLMIAGSITGLFGSCLNSLGSFIALGCVWLLAICAAILNSISLSSFRTPNMACYIGACIIALTLVPDLLLYANPLAGIIFLAGGGCYLIALGFYTVSNRFQYTHLVFHICIVLGSLFHVASILLVLLG